jgi:hypothetical protein
MKKCGSLWSIAYRGLKVPDGYPPVLAEILVIGHCSRPPEVLLEVPFTPGGGYTLTFTHVAPPPKQMKKETLASVRKQRLGRKLEAKVPMFAEHFATLEMEKKQDYYEGETDAKIEREKQEVLERTEERYAFLMGRAGELVVYADEPASCAERARIIREDLIKKGAVLS